MAKRSRQEDSGAVDVSNVQPRKRLRYEHIDRLSNLSDELLLRVLSFLSTSNLAVCQRLSQRFHALAGDPQLWKSKYYNRFVRPRASRIPGLRDSTLGGNALLYSSRLSKWLGDDHLVRNGDGTDWKWQYKLRHNWSRGSCEVREIQVAEQRSIPPMLIQLNEDVVFTADSYLGLRAWLTKGSQRLLATLPLDPTAAPTSLAIDSTKDKPSILKVCLGFSDGRFRLYSLDKRSETLSEEYTHAASTNGIVSAMAYASPHLITMTDAQLLSLYHFPKSDLEEEENGIKAPLLLSSLKSHTAWPPLSLSIRVSSAHTDIVVSVAYALPTYLSGWTVGLQELRITSSGDVTRSKLAYAASQGFAPLATTASDSLTPTPESESAGIGSQSPTAGIPSMTKPTCLSYSHPYLLASHPDNTLTLYLVHSSETELTISSGSRLWGHTSSVSGAHVGDRGKAVSVSTHGDEIRIWELEGGLRSSSYRKRMASGEASVQVRPEKRHANLSANSYPPIHSPQHSTGAEMDDLSTTRGWVGFDEEKVIVLREKGYGTQALVVYDFS